MDEAAAPLVQLANEETVVSDFVSEVQEEYPESVLNDILVRPGG
jgi:hypothetical protein